MSRRSSGGLRGPILLSMIDVFSITALAMFFFVSPEVREESETAAKPFSGQMSMLVVEPASAADERARGSLPDFVQIGFQRKDGEYSIQKDPSSGVLLNLSMGDGARLVFDPSGVRGDGLRVSVFLSRLGEVDAPPREYVARLLAPNARRGRESYGPFMLRGSGQRTLHLSVVDGVVSRGDQ